MLDPQTSRRIFELAQDQQKELEADNVYSDEEDTNSQLVPESFKQIRVVNNEEEDDDIDSNFNFGEEDEYDAEEYAEIVSM